MILLIDKPFSRHQRIVNPPDIIYNFKKTSEILTLLFLELNGFNQAFISTFCNCRTL